MLSISALEIFSFYGWTNAVVDGHQKLAAVDYREPRSRCTRYGAHLEYSSERFHAAQTSGHTLPAFSEPAPVSFRSGTPPPSCQCKPPGAINRDSACTAATRITENVLLDEAWGNPSFSGVRSTGTLNAPGSMPRACRACPGRRRPGRNEARHHPLQKQQIRMIFSHPDRAWSKLFREALAQVGRLRNRYSPPACRSRFGIPAEALPGLSPPSPEPAPQPINPHTPIPVLSRKSNGHEAMARGSYNLT